VARINYFVIEQAIETALRAASDLSGATITLEEDVELAVEQVPWIGIYLASRQDAGGPIAAGKQQRFRVRFEVWCFEHDTESLTAASRKRDDLMGKVEIALLNDPTLGSTVALARITGGEFESGRTEAGFLMGGSILLDVEQTATTT